MRQRRKTCAGWFCFPASASRLIFMTLLRRSVCFRGCTWSFLSVGKNEMWLLFFFSSDKLPIAGFTYRTLWVGWEEHDHLDIIFMSKNGMRQGKLLACMWRRLLMQFLLPGVHHYLWWSRDKLACSEEEWTTSGSTHGLAGSIWLHAFLTCIVHLVLWWWEIRRAGDTCGLNGRVRDVEWMKSPWALLSWWEASLRRSCCPPECVHMLKRAIFGFWRDSAWQKSWIVLEI